MVVFGPARALPSMERECGIVKTVVRGGRSSLCSNRKESPRVFLGGQSHSLGPTDTCSRVAPALQDLFAFKASTARLRTTRSAF